MWGKAIAFVAGILVTPALYHLTDWEERPRIQLTAIRALERTDFHAGQREILVHCNTQDEENFDCFTGIFCEELGADVGRALLFTFDEDDNGPTFYGFSGPQVYRPGEIKEFEAVPEQCRAARQ